MIHVVIHVLVCAWRAHRFLSSVSKLVIVLAYLASLKHSSWADITNINGSVNELMVVWQPKGQADCIGCIFTFGKPREALGEVKLGSDTHAMK